MMKLPGIALSFLTASLLLVLTGAAVSGDWRQALPGWKYEFPRDHGSHPGFKTEWWYFTGQLHTQDGQRFGYQITFFRQGIRPPDARAATRSRLIVNDLPFGHAALTDVGASKFRFTQRMARGAFGEAGFGNAESTEQPIAWIDPWSLRLDEAGNYAVTATIEDAKLDLNYVPEKPWVFHGHNGVSQKAAGEGRGSHYYSGTRLRTSGTLTIGTERMAVSGESWFDHEWSSNQLTPEQSGWNWFSLQFDDGSELMLFQMRLRGGGTGSHSSGTFIDPSGNSTHVTANEFRAEPQEFWTSPRTKARYPVAWRITVDRLGMELHVTTPVKEQELHLEPVAYWEGLIDIKGTRAGKPIAGHGYIELTGYAGEVVGLTSQDPTNPDQHR